tara:strand:+ start:513 stop:689 length:177 start_codon:yes stop_codon:yes gene_type:complete
MPRTLNKGLRDLIIIGLSAVLIALAENAGDFGIPVETVPIVSAAALAIYRIVRDNAQK